MLPLFVVWKVFRFPYRGCRDVAVVLSSEPAGVAVAVMIRVQQEGRRMGACCCPTADCWLTNGGCCVLSDPPLSQGILHVLWLVTTDANMQAGC